MDEGFSAVYIAAGAQASKRIGIPGEEEGLEGLYYGLEFLMGIKEEKTEALHGKVVVLGGGNVAIDVARTALRVGAQEVQLFCLESREEMPAWEKDVDEAIEEGIVINPSWGPKRINHSENRVTGVEFARCVSVFDDEGRFNPSFDEEARQIVEADVVIISIGQAPDISFLSEDSQLERALWGGLTVDENSLATNIQGVFAGGDFTAGPTYAIRAISSGRRAAIAIDKYLKGDRGRIEIVDEKTELGVHECLALDDEETTEERPRIKTQIEGPEERVRDFREVEKGFNEEEAKLEAERCLRCDLEEELGE
jgi:NADH-quinone oxidoreductase subunit F